MAHWLAVLVLDAVADWTLGLLAVGSIATAFMAGFTWMLARGSQAEVAAQWTPVVLAALVKREPTERRGLIKHTGLIFYDEAEGTLSLPVRNVGRGPALDLRGAELDNPESFASDYALALAPDDEGRLEFSQVWPTAWRRLSDERKSLGVLLRYRDLTGLGHTSALVIHMRTEDERIFSHYSTYLKEIQLPVRAVVLRVLIRLIPTPIRRRIRHPQPRIGSGTPPTQTG